MGRKPPHLPCSVAGACSALLAVAALAGPPAPTLDSARQSLRDGRYADAESAARALLGAAEAEHGRESLPAAEFLDLLVEALWRNGKTTRPETTALARRALQIKESAEGAEDSSLASSLSQLGWVVFNRGEGESPAVQDEGIALAERALAMQEQILGPEHPDVATTLDRLGMMVFHRRSDAAAGRRLFERSLAIRERALGDRHPLVARSLQGLAATAQGLGEASVAIDLLERALSIQEGALGARHPEVGTTLLILSTPAQIRGQYERARQTAERALAIFECAHGRLHTDVALALFRLGSWHRAAGDNRAAIDLIDDAIAIFRLTTGEEHRDTAMAMVILGNTQYALGDWPQAQENLEHALSILEHVGPDRSEMAMALTYYAPLLAAKGDYANAKQNLERALDIGRVIPPSTADSFIGFPLVTYANLLRRMGDVAAAVKLLEQALTIAERVFGPEEAYNVPTALDYLASALLQIGDSNRALEISRRALVLRERKLHPDHPALAQTLSTLGSAFRAAGALDSARICHERALALWEKAGRDDAVAGALEAMAELHLHAGEHAEAARGFERATELYERFLGPEHGNVGAVLVDLAEARWRLGTPVEQVLEPALRGEEIGRENLRLTASRLSETLAARLAAERASGLDVLISMPAGALDAAARAKVGDALVRSRAVVLDEMAARHRTVQTAEDPEVGRLFAAYVSKGERLANLAVRGPGPEGAERYRQLLDGAREESERAEEALARASAAFRATRARARLGLDEVAGALPEGSALVAYSVYNHLGGEAISSYAALVLRAGTRAPDIVPLGAASEIDSLVRMWRGELLNGTEAACRAGGARVRARIWDPVWTRAGGAERAFIVPDGALNLVSFAALPAGGTGYLAELGPLLHYLSAERDLVPAMEATAGGEGLLAVGGPDFEAGGELAGLGARHFPERASQGLATAAPDPFRGERSACGDFASLAFEALPGAGDEAEEIAAVWRRATGAGTTVLRGPEATETAFKRHAAGPRILHLSTHGFFLGGRCPSALAGRRGIGGVGTAAAVTAGFGSLPPVAGENPLLLAGLAFARANHRQAARPGEDDGILTAQEIATLDLGGAEWAVLSACDTGLGEIRAGEGVFGLRRAFQVAGARTLIMSLWPVDDEAARRWMRALYEARFAEGLGTAEAVRAASLAVLGERRAAGQDTHPLAWAGFLAAGDWR